VHNAAVRFSALGIALFVAIVSSPPTPAHADSRTFHIGLVEQPNSLDPLHASQFYENYLCEGIFSALVVIDDRGEPSPDLAEVVPTKANGGISADGKTITYHLRPGVRWQDGVPLTSHDVAYTYARMEDPKSNFISTALYTAIAKIETPDDRTVVMRLKEPWADATTQLFVNGQNGSILPQHVLEKIGDLNQSSFESAPVGSGPYMLDRWERGNRIVLRANPVYFRGKPHIDRIDIDFVPDQSTLGIRMRTGELDFSPQLTPVIARQLGNVARLRQAIVPQYTALQFEFNTKAAPFDDVRVRQALVLAVDRKRLAQTAYHGLAIPADDLVPPQSAFYRSDPQVPLGGDPARAAELLDAAGWRRGPGGLRAKSGATLSVALVYPTGYAAITACVVQVQAAWRALGIDATLRTIQSPLLYSPTGILASGDFGVSLTTFGYATSPDRAQNITTSGLPPRGFNYPRVSDPEIDALTESARRTYEFSRRKAIYAKISAIVRGRALLVPVLWIENEYAYDKQLTGLRPEPVNFDFWNVYSWQFP
jgi:peptide/nickel transport system substrate-binding protein